MVCLLGTGRMAVMARLLAAGGFSQSVTEEVGHQKLAAQILFKELSEALEPNLLDEEDMHLFDLRPMADPLHLVCCNTCKKIVKTSQYAAHAELCRMLKSTEQSMLAGDESVRHKKSARKERKKSVTAYANQAMPVEELERSVCVNDAAVAQSQLDGQIVINSSCHMVAKTYVDSKTLMDSSGVSPGNSHNSIGVMPRPTKRSKLIKDEERQSSGRASPKGTVSAADLLNGDVIGYKKNELVHRHGLPVEEPDVPAPLATKIYYSQRNNRLRSALCHLYYETVASSKEFRSNAMNPELSNGIVYKSQTVTQKMDSSSSMPSVQNPAQICAQSSEMYLGSSGVCLTPSEFSKQFPTDNSPMPQVASGGLARNKFLSKPYSLTGNSGQSLGTVQQQNGSVSVL